MRIRNHTNIPIPLDYLNTIIEDLYGCEDEYGVWQEGDPYITLHLLKKPKKVSIHRVLLYGYPPITIYHRTPKYDIFTDGNMYYHNIDSEEEFIMKLLHPYLW